MDLEHLGYYQLLIVEDALYHIFTVLLLFADHQALLPCQKFYILYFMPLFDLVLQDYGILFFLFDI